MPKDPQSLTNREIKILFALADGNSYEELRHQFDPPLTLANVHTTCHHIRQKTGIRQTRDQFECKRYLDRMDPQTVKNAIAPTPSQIGSLTGNQMTVLRLLAMNRSYPQIAAFLGINSQSVQNLASRACQRAGITHRGWDRTQAISKWLAQNDPDLPASLDPMSDPAF